MKFVFMLGKCTDKCFSKLYLLRMYVEKLGSLEKELYDGVDVYKVPDGPYVGNLCRQLYTKRVGRIVVLKKGTIKISKL